MRKFFYYLFSIIGVIVLILILIPLFFKNDIIREISNTAEKKLDMRISYDKVQLSMFARFPKMSLSFNNLTVVTNNSTTKDTLAQLGRVEGAINFMSLFRGEYYIIDNFTLKNGELAYTTTTDSTTVNTPEATPSTTDNEAGETKGIQINRLEFQNIKAAFRNASDNSAITVDSINALLLSDMKGDTSLVNLHLAMNGINYHQNDAQMLTDINIDWTAKAKVLINPMKIDLQDNVLKINDLAMAIDGSVAQIQDNWDINLTTGIKDSSLKELFSILSSSVAKQLADYNTEGTFMLDANVNGLLTDTKLPKIDVTFKIKDGAIIRPNYPEKLQDINVLLSVHNPGETIDSTTFHLQQMNFKLGENPFQMTMLLRNPNDWFIDGAINGQLNFDKMKQIMSINSEMLSGQIDMDVKLKGFYHYIEAQEYEKFNANGNIAFNDLTYKNPQLGTDFQIYSGKMNVTPEKLTLRKVETVIYDAKMTLEGYLSNYIPYFIKHQNLKGNFRLASDYIDLNDIIAKTNQANASDTLDVADSVTTVLEIPKNLDVTVTTEIKKMLLDKLEMQAIRGQLVIAKGIADFKNLSMNMLNGQMTISGSYSSVNPKAPAVKLNVKIDNFDIIKAYSSFSILRKTLPFAQYCKGTLDANLNINGNMNEKMELSPASLDGNGFIATPGINILPNPFLSSLSTIIKKDKLNSLNISSLTISMKMDKGNLTLLPFTTMVGTNKLTLQGTQKVTGEMDYDLQLMVQRSYFGSQIDDLLKKVPGSSNITELPLDVTITGTTNSPKVTPDLSKAIKAVSNAAIQDIKKKSGSDILNSFKKIFK